MGMAEIEQNKMEGTGLFAGTGNKSGKISRIKKARKWRDFAGETAKDGIVLGRYGYEQLQGAVNPVSSVVKKMFEFGAEKDADEESEGSKISFKNIKKAYNKNVKYTKLGKAARQSAKKIRDNTGYGGGKNKKFGFGGGTTVLTRAPRGRN